MYRHSILWGPKKRPRKAKYSILSTGGEENEGLLRDLSVGSEMLFTLQSDFVNCCRIMRSCLTVSFYETEDTSTVEVSS